MRAPRRTTLAVALFGLAAAWSGGNVGPVAGQVAARFDVSLASVGLLSGTLYLGATVVGLLFASEIGRRAGLVRGARIACGLLIAGNLAFALSPVLVGLAAGRVLAGLAFALTNTLGAVWARRAGGVRLLGIFGASIQLGLALALLVGSALSDLGAGWRLGFVLSALLGALALLAIPGGAGQAEPTPRPGSGFLRAAVGRLRVYRLSLVFMGIFGVPLILSAWLVEFLFREGDVARSVAGAVAFLLFAVSSGMRLLGARLRMRGVPHAVTAGALVLAALGLLVLAQAPSILIAFLCAAALGTGVGIPYATALSEAQDLYPAAPAEPVALMTLLALAPPILVIPLVGHALDRGDGASAFLALAVFLGVAGVANLRPTGIPVADPTDDGSELA
jgi:MFS family permease